MHYLYPRESTPKLYLIIKGYSSISKREKMGMERAFLILFKEELSIGKVNEKKIPRIYHSRSGL